MTGNPALTSTGERIGYSYAYRHREELPDIQFKAYDASPNVRFQFDWNRDPYIRLQMMDRGKSEKQRRDEATGGGSSMVEKDRAAPSFRPHDHLGKLVDREHYNQRWMAELREAVLSAAKTIEQEESRGRSRAPVAHEPSR